MVFIVSADFCVQVWKRLCVNVSHNFVYTFVFLYGRVLYSYEHVFGYGSSFRGSIEYSDILSNSVTGDTAETLRTHVLAWDEMELCLPVIEGLSTV
jgi:hypothetical protein